MSVKLAAPTPTTPPAPPYKSQFDTSSFLTEFVARILIAPFAFMSALDIAETAEFTVLAIIPAVTPTAPYAEESLYDL